MDINSKFDQFETAYKQAVETIKQLQNSGDKDVQLIVNWLLTTDSNPYGFLPKDWAGSMNDAVGFASFCHLIDHALVDDGEINFITIDQILVNKLDPLKSYTVKGEPKISFVQRFIDDYQTIVLSEHISNSGYVRNGYNVEYQINSIKGVQEFITAHGEYELYRLQQSFMISARRDIEQAIENFKNKPLFKQEWIETARNIIDQKKSSTL